MVTLSIGQDDKTEVLLEQNYMYRVGRRLNLEIFIDDESIELAHATISHISGGIILISPVAGTVFVNDQEVGLQVKSISEKDTIDGLIHLRFGNVTVKLNFKDTKLPYNREANDTSGFEEGTKDKSANITSDSLLIPESEPQSANTTGNTDSFMIPETQAICLNRPSTGHMQAKVSLGDDFMIPETQDVLLNIDNPILAQQDRDMACDDNSSELGTQIRICTQEFNEFNEDAIDDFDSSLLLGDGGLAVFPPPEQADENNVLNVDISDLNWSATNAKCTALNSTKTGDSSPRRDICLTPELSISEQRTEDLNVPCTPDIFDLLGDQPNECLGSCTPELNVPTIAISRSSNVTNVNEGTSVAKQTIVSSIETPETTPSDPLDISQDLIETQAFPIRTKPLSQPKTIGNVANKSNKSVGKETNSDDDNEDFIETQAFPGSRPQFKSNNTADNSQDFIATQAFVIPQPYASKLNKTTGTMFSTTAQIHNHNEDFIETQVFPKRTSLPAPAPAPAKSPIASESNDNLEDFIATQAFVRPTKQPAIKLNRTSESNLNVSSVGDHNNTEDMMETQLFIPPAKTNGKATDNGDDRLEITGTFKANDDFDHEISLLIGLSEMPSSPSDEEQIKNIVQPSADSKKNNKKEISAAKELKKADKTSKKDPSKYSGSKRPATLSESSEESPNKKMCVDTHSGSPPPDLSTRTRRKRSLELNSSLSCESKSSPAAPKKTCDNISQTADCSLEADTKEDKSVNKKSDIHRKRGRPAKSCRIKQLTVRLEDVKSKLACNNEVLAKEDKSELNRTYSEERIESNGEPCSNDSKSRKAIRSRSSHDKPAPVEEKESSRVKPRKQSQNTDAQLLEKNGNEKAKSSKSVQNSKEDAPTTKRELRNRAKSPEQPTRKSKPSTNQRERRKSTTKTTKTELPGLKSTNQDKTTSLESLSEDELPTTSANARLNGFKKVKPATRNPLKDLNEYIRKIKSSGRKIQLALSMCNTSEVYAVLKALKNAIEITEDPLNCDLLIMDRGERTYKFLVAVASNKPILSTRWLHGIKESRSINIELEHIFKDERFEQLFKFKPTSILENANLLNRLDFLLGNEIQPSAKDMKAIIESAGGRVHSKPPPIASNVHLYVVASKHDKNIWQLLRNYSNVQYIKTEGVMQALVQQKVELLDEHKLKM